MALYRRKPVEVQAVRWWRDGDHPDVRPYGSQSSQRCQSCGQPYRSHGWLNHSINVCPGDWILEDARGVRRMRPDEFRAKYEPVQEARGE